MARDDDTVGRYTENLVQRANRGISTKKPQAMDLRDQLDDIGAPSFRGGQVTWSPKSPYDEEQVINHLLGRIPVGLIFLGGTVPMASYWFTKAQRARWTEEKLYFHIATHGLYDAGQGDLVSGNATTVDLGRSVRFANAVVSVVSKEPAAFDHSPIKAEDWILDTSDSTKFNRVTVKKADESNVGANHIEFSWAAWGAITDDDEFVWQVI